MDTTIPHYPEEDGQDIALDFLRHLSKGTLNAVPILGPFFAEAIDFCYRRPIEKRRDEWFGQLLTIH
jgi:hypothetical protein